MFKKSIFVLSTAALAFFVGASINSNKKPKVPTVKNDRLSAVRLIGDQFGGSGAFISYNNKNYILTNAHVCEAAIQSRIMKVITEDNKIMYRQVLKLSDRHDLCLLEGDASYPALTIATSTYVGENLKVYGHPKLQPLTITDAQYIGDVLIQLLIEVNKSKESCKGTWQEANDMEKFLFGVNSYCIAQYPSSQIHGYSQPGSSGSPVLNSQGEISGVIFAGDRKDQFQSFMVPLFEVQKFLAE